MRIAHVNFARGFRGGERQTLNLIDGLARLGMTQTQVCRSGSELARRAPQRGVPTVELRHPLLGHWAPPASDLIHVHEARGAYWAALECLARNTPYVVTRRIPTPISASRLTRAVYRHATELFGVSRDVAARLSLQTGRNVRTVLSCSTRHRACAAAPALRRALGKGPVIGHVGVLNDRHKGQSILIQAFHRLAVAYPDARLVLVGDGPDRGYFEALAGRDARIVFAGFQEDVGAWIEAMDVFAFPSREEGLGSSVLDAMALGIPVAASAVGGLPELVGADERGLLVEHADAAHWHLAIRRLLDDAPLRARLAATARAFALQNNEDAMARQYAACYASILAPVVADCGWLATGAAIRAQGHEEFYAGADFQHGAAPMHTNVNTGKNL